MSPEVQSYRNPIIPGYAPDPTCVQHRGTYYLLTSSFLTFPSLPIYTSTNLLDWTLRSNVVLRPEQLPRLNQAGVKFPIGGGLWAPSLRFRPDREGDKDGEGEWFVTVTLVFPQTEYGAKERWENLLFKSRDPLKWGNPVKFDFPGYDTSIAWDQEGKAFVQGAHYWRVRPEILQIPLDLSSGSALGPPQKIWSGLGGHAPEAPHAYWKDGWWWVMLAEGGTEAGHRSTMARSRTLTAPHSEWETCPHNPLLISCASSTPTPNASHFTTIGHADLFQTPEGEWFAVALATRDGREGSEASMGRETVMVPVVWDEGEWPVFQQVEGEMQGRLGGAEHEEVEGVPLLAEGGREDLLALSAEWRAKSPEDAYAYPPHVIFLRLPLISSYRLSSSSLFLTPSPTTLSRHPVAPFSPYPIDNYPCTTADDKHAGTCTFIGRRQTDLEGSMSATLGVIEEGDGSEGGLAVFLDETHNLMFGFNSDKIFLRSTAADSEKISASIPSTADTAEGMELKVEWTMSVYSFFYRPSTSSSLSSTEWQKLGEALAKDVTGGFTGVILGVWASLEKDGKEVEGKGKEVEVRQWEYESRRKW